MWIELLTELSEINPFIKINLPANFDEIINAEKKLNIEFPIELKECLLEINGDGDALLSVQSIVDIHILMKGLNNNDDLLRVATNGCGGP